jgi:hypothetical protein
MMCIACESYYNRSIIYEIGACDYDTPVAVAIACWQPRRT